MRSALVLALLSIVVGCPRSEAVTPGSFGPTPAATPAEKVGDPSAPLDFALEPLDRDFDFHPESEALRGKRAIVLILQSYDVGSLMALRTLSPLLNELPKDVLCLLVAVQPIGDKALIGPFMDAEKTPCRRAIGDPARGKLGDLAKVRIIPTVLVLRADGTLAGGHAGKFEVSDVRALLDKAR